MRNRNPLVVAAVVVVAAWIVLTVLHVLIRGLFAVAGLTVLVLLVAAGWGLYTAGRRSRR